MFASTKQNEAKTPAREARQSEPEGRGETSAEINPLWQSLALGTLAVQTKLAVSQPDDPLEQEADRVADHVMRKAIPAPPISEVSVSTNAFGRAQRKCSSCEEEEDQQVQRKEESGAKPDSPATDPSIVNQVINSPSKPLDANAQSYMESQFGRDFSQVRVHDDSRAAASANAIQASAYTLGSHIVFGAGRYQPGSNDGRRLLAHELAHTLQQGSAGSRIQRDTKDFRVTQVQDKPEERTQGMLDRFFFEIDQSDFREEVAAEKAERMRLEAWAKAHTGKHVTLVGRASQEGSKVGNKELANQRTTTVAQVLKKNGVFVDGVDVDMKYEQRPVDYRFYRSVEIVTGGPTCSPAQKTKDLADCETAFTAAHVRATAIANAAMDRLRPDEDPATATAPADGAPVPESRDTVLAARFPDITRDTVLPRFESVVTRLAQIAAPAGHECNDRCAPECERPASAGAGGPVTLCAPFYIPSLPRGLPVNLQVFAVLHENTHSAVVSGSSPAASVGIDIAYSKTRLFGVLTGSEALLNADSYVMTLLALAGTAGGAPAVISARGGPPADSFQLVTPAGESGDRNRTARRAIGFADSWLNYASFWAPDLYDFLDASQKKWPADLNTTEHALLELWAPLFGLSHPGSEGLDADSISKIATFQTSVGARFPTPAPAKHSTAEDRTRAAGIYDRYIRMHDFVYTQALTIEPATTVDGTWSSAAGLPGLGTTVQLPERFFISMTAIEQSRHIVRLLALAMSDINGTLVQAYVEGADGVHQYRGLGP